MNLVLQPIRVGTGRGEEEGRLVLADGRLIAVLVHLADGHYEELTGRWFLEAGFGQLDGPDQPVFTDLIEAQVWTQARLGARPYRPARSSLH